VVTLIAFVPRSTEAPTQPAYPKKTKNIDDRVPPPEQRLKANSNLDSFEAVMQAMDEQLASSRESKYTSIPNAKGKGKAKAMVGEHDEDIEAAMDAELKASLERGNSDDDDKIDGTEERTDYNLIKNFLESFKSQGGLPGPVSNLAGRLQPGWKLPRDD
jgi:hypothetical protein